MSDPNPAEVLDDALSVLAEWFPGYRGLQSGDSAKITLADVAEDHLDVEYLVPHPYGQVSGFRIRVTVEDLGAPEPCEFEIRPARLFLPPEPAETCDEGVVPGERYCRTHIGAAS